MKDIYVIICDNGFIKGFSTLSSAKRNIYIGRYGGTAYDRWGNVVYER